MEWATQVHFAASTKATFPISDNVFKKKDIHSLDK